MAATTENKGLTTVVNEFPHKIENVPDKENELIKKDFQGYLSGVVRVQPGGYFFQKIYEDYALKLYTFPLRTTDVFVASYPKCGTTWTQEMVWLLIHNMDYDGAKVALDTRFPFLEADHVLDPDVFKLPGICEKLSCAPPQPGDRLVLANNLPNPRTIKTHMPFSLLPPKLLDTCKVIYVARNPRDVVVSYYHHHRMWATHGYTGDFKKFFDYFINEQLMWSPFWSHIKEAWEMRHHTNLLLLTYDELKADLPAAITKVASFLGKNVSSDNMKSLTTHLHIDSMRNNPAVNSVEDAAAGLLDLKEGGFVRKGKPGGWVEYFDDEMNKKFDLWIKEKGCGLQTHFNWK